MSLSQVLDASAAALQRGETDAAAAELLRAWREAPYAELAAALERFPKRPFQPEEGTPTAEMNAWLEAWGRAGPLDLPALLAHLEHVAGTRLPRFAKPCFDAVAAAPADPRIGAFVLSRIGHPVPSLKQTISMLWRQASPRDLEALDRLANQTGGGWFKPVVNTLKRKAASLKPLDADLRGRIIELGLEAAKAPLPKVTEAGEAVLLERVRAAPDDVSCREVLRDWLLERGDPWGELIALQQHRARDAQATMTARERKLLKELRPRILGSLGGAKKSVLDEVVIERGFPVSATVKVKGVTRVAAILSRPELSTLERVVFVRDATLTPNLKALREAHGLQAESLAAALKRAPDLKLEVLTVDGGPGHLEGLGGLGALRELYFIEPGMPERTLRAAARLPLMKQLRAIGVVQVYAGDAFHDWSWELVDSLPAPVERVVIETMGGMTARFVFARASDGWDVRVEPPVTQRSTHPGYASIPHDAETFRRAKAVLKESRSVQFSGGVDEQTRAALEP